MEREHLARMSRRGGSRTALAKNTNQHAPSPLTGEGWGEGEDTAYQTDTV